jgi:FixJ family two-component response regulator
MAKTTTRPVTNVFLIIRDREVRTALASELNEAGYYATDYQTAREFLIDKPRYLSGVVIGELRMLDMMWSELSEQLSGEKESFPVVLYVNDADTPKAIKAGVDFFCLPLSTEKVIAAIQRTKEPEQFSERKLEWFFNRITPTEWKIFEAVCAGKSSREIAQELGNSTKTIEAHRARINAKSQATDVAQLIRMHKAWEDLQW